MAGKYASLFVISRFQAELDRLFQEALQMGEGQLAGGGWQPPVDIVENATSIVVLVEVPGEAAIEFDPGHLHQVMWNLLRNAVRYARAAPGAVRIAARAAGDRVELSVIDNGPGVPGSSQGQLFEPFFTTDSKGTGLGLYLARELCAANRASLEYVRESSGAHFRVVARGAKP